MAHKKTKIIKCDSAAKISSYHERLLDIAIKVIGEKYKALVWLSSPQVGLGGWVPIVYAVTKSRAKEVEQLLGRIEHGVYS